MSARKICYTCGAETASRDMARHRRRNHMALQPAPPIPDRFVDKVVITENGCFEWQGCVGISGYSSVRTGGPGGGVTALGHRYAYEALVEPIPAGLELDHLCMNTRCVNPDHLEPVTGAENRAREYARQTHCKHGHEFTSENTYMWRGHRQCRPCNRARARAYAARQKDRRLVASAGGA